MVAVTPAPNANGEPAIAVPPVATLIVCVYDPVATALPPALSMIVNGIVVAVGVPGETAIVDAGAHVVTLFVKLVLLNTLPPAHVVLL